MNRGPAPPGLPARTFACSECGQVLSAQPGDAAGSKEILFSGSEEILEWPGWNLSPKSRWHPTWWEEREPKQTPFQGPWDSTCRQQVPYTPGPSDKATGHIPHPGLMTWPPCPSVPLGFPQLFSPLPSAEETRSWAGPVLPRSAAPGQGEGRWPGEPWAGGSHCKAASFCRTPVSSVATENGVQWDLCGKASEPPWPHLQSTPRPF